MTDQPEENKEMERDSISTFPHYPLSLSISYIKNRLIFSKNVKYGILSRMSQKT